MREKPSVAIASGGVMDNSSNIKTSKMVTFEFKKKRANVGVKERLIQKKDVKYSPLIHFIITF